VYDGLKVPHLIPLNTFQEEKEQLWTCNIAILVDPSSCSTKSLLSVQLDSQKDLPRAKKSLAELTRTDFQTFKGTIKTLNREINLDQFWIMMAQVVYEAVDPLIRVRTNGRRPSPLRSRVATRLPSSQKVAHELNRRP
jgi:hypothetical protein